MAESTLFLEIVNDKKFIAELSDRYEDLKVKDNHGKGSFYNIIFKFVIDNRKSLSSEQWDELIKNMMLDQFYELSECPPVILALRKFSQLNFTEEQWVYLIENTDLSSLREQDKEYLVNVYIKKLMALPLNNLADTDRKKPSNNFSYVPPNFFGNTNPPNFGILNGQPSQSLIRRVGLLFYSLKNNKKKKLNLTEKEWNELIGKSDLSQVDEGGRSALSIALEYSKTQQLTLSTDQWLVLINSSQDSLFPYQEQIANLVKEKPELSNVDNSQFKLAAIVNGMELNEKQWEILVKGNDIKQDGVIENPTMFLLHQKEKLNLNNTQVEYLINRFSERELNDIYKKELLALIDQDKKEKKIDLNNKHWADIVINARLLPLILGRDENFSSMTEQLEFIVRNGNLSKISNKDKISLLSIFKEGYEKEDPLTKEQWMYLIHNSDLLITALALNEKVSLNLSSELLQVLIQSSDLSRESESGLNALMSAFAFNKEQGLNLSPEQIEYLLKNSDLTQHDATGMNPLVLALKNNVSQGLNLSPEQIEYLFEKTKLPESTVMGMHNLFLTALESIKNGDLNLSSEQLNYLLENSSFSYDKRELATSLLTVLKLNEENKIKITPEQFSYLLEQADFRLNSEEKLEIMMALSKTKEPQWEELSKTLCEKFYGTENKKPNFLMFVLSKNREAAIGITPEKLEELIKVSDISLVDDYGNNALSLALKNNKSLGLNLNSEQLDYLIKNSDVYQVESRDRNALLLAFQYKKEQGLNLTEEQITYLIKKSDLQQKGENGLNALLYAVQHNKTLGLNLTQEQISLLIKGSDLSQLNERGESPLVLALNLNKDQELNLTTEQLDTLIRYSDLSVRDALSKTPLMLVLENNSKNELNLNPEQIDYLIRLSDLHNLDWQKNNTLIYAFRNNVSQKLNLSSEQIDFLIEQTTQPLIMKLAQNPELFKDNDFMSTSSFALMVALSNHQKENLNLSSEQWDVLISCTNLSQIDLYACSSLDKIILENIKQGKPLKTHQYAGSSLDKIILENIKQGKPLKTHHIDKLITQMIDSDLEEDSLRGMFETLSRRAFQDAGGAVSFRLLEKINFENKSEFFDDLMRFENNALMFEKGLIFKQMLKDKYFKDAINLDTYCLLNRKLKTQVKFKDFSLSDVENKVDLEKLKEKMLEGSSPIQLKDFSEEQKNKLFTKEFIVELCKKNPDNLQFLSTEQRNDINLAFALLKESGENIKYLGSEIKEVFGLVEKSSDYNIKVLEEFVDIKFFNIFKKKVLAEKNEQIQQKIGNKLNLDEYEHLIVSIYPLFGRIGSLLDSRFEDVQIKFELIKTKQMLREINQLNGSDLAEQSRLKIAGTAMLQNPNIENLSKFNEVFEYLLNEVKERNTNQIRGFISVIKSKYETLSKEFYGDKDFAPIEQTKEKIFNVNDYEKMIGHKDNLPLLNKLNVISSDNKGLCWLTNYEAIEWRSVDKILRQAVEINKKLNTPESNEMLTTLLKEVDKIADVQIDKIRQRMGLGPGDGLGDRFEVLTESTFRNIEMLLNFDTFHEKYKMELINNKENFSRKMKI